MSAFITGAGTGSASTSLNPPSNEVSIVVNGTQWNGWQSIEITRGIETVPSSFSLMGTERFPGVAGQTTVDIPLTAPAQIKIGSDLIITGYVDTAERSYTAESHQILFTGRSKLS